MIRARCPICGKQLEGPNLDALPHFPFCSERCRWIDLGRWADGSYVIPGPPIEEVEDGGFDGPPRSDDRE